MNTDPGNIGEKQQGETSSADILAKMPSFEDRNRVQISGEITKEDLDNIIEKLPSDRKSEALHEAEHMHWLPEADVSEEIRKVIIEKGDYYKDNRKYYASEWIKTAVRQPDGRVSLEYEQFDKFGPEGYERVKKYRENENTTVSKCIRAEVIEPNGKHGYDEYYSEDVFSKYFSEDEDGNYTNQRLYKGLVNNTEVLLIRPVYVGKNESIIDAEKQCILAECDEDGTLVSEKDLVDGTIMDFVKTTKQTEQ